MPMSGDILGAAIAAELLSGQTGLSAEEIAAVTAKWQQICGIIVLHIQSNAVVTVATTGVTGSGPYGGPFPIMAQPGVGTVA